MKRLHIELPSEVEAQLNAGAQSGSVECVFR
jgi:hypothetical protein